MYIDFQFLQSGGVPLTANLMDEIKKSFEIYNELGNLAGNLTIIKGCEDISATEVAPGIVFVNGEILPFEGGTKSDFVFVQTTEILKTFKDQTQKILIKKKVVKFGNSTPPNIYNWLDFKKIKNLLELNAKVDALADDMALANKKLAVFQQNGVCFPWRKPVEDIPPGFAPVWELAGRTVVGLDPNDTDFDTVGKLFGEKKHKLTVEEIPAHSHKVPLFANGSATGNAVGHPDNYIDYNRVIDSRSTGGDQPHNNVQPSYTAPYIEWVG